MIGLVQYIVHKIEDYIISTSLTTAQIIELVTYSTSDPILAKWTSDTSRFSSEEATIAWLQTNPEYIVLTDHQGSLLGIAWLQSTAIPENSKHTLKEEEALKYIKTSAIRLYGSARGKGLGVCFYTQLFKRFPSPHVWAKISDDNTASKHLHEKLGFMQVSKPDNYNKIILVRDERNN